MPWCLQCHLLQFAVCGKCYGSQFIWDTWLLIWYGMRKQFLYRGKTWRGKLKSLSFNCYSISFLFLKCVLHRHHTSSLPGKLLSIIICFHGVSKLSLLPSFLSVLGVGFKVTLCQVCFVAIIISYFSLLYIWRNFILCGSLWNIKWNKSRFLIDLRYAACI